LASPPYDVLGLVVLTDGVENTSPMIADVSASITANTFAVGLGRSENISVAALNALTLGHNGYLLVTGLLDPSQAARLNKYFLQILAGITNANVVLDPGGVVTPGAVHRIPFNVSEAEFGLDRSCTGLCQAHLAKAQPLLPRIYAYSCDRCGKVGNW
jgi:hypothetical protein